MDWSGVLLKIKLNLSVVNFQDEAINIDMNADKNKSDEKPVKNKNSKLVRSFKSSLTLSLDN